MGTRNGTDQNKSCRTQAQVVAHKADRASITRHLVIPSNKDERLDGFFQKMVRLKTAASGTNHAQPRATLLNKMIVRDYQDAIVKGKRSEGNGARSGSNSNSAGVAGDVLKGDG